jgi:hypothetical protein
VSDENAILRLELTFARGASISVEVPSPSPNSLLATASVQDWITDKVSAKHLLSSDFHLLRCYTLIHIWGTALLV